MPGWWACRWARVSVARPRSENPRDKTLRVRVTGEEKDRIAAVAQASGLDVSDYVRSRALGDRAPRSDSPPSPEVARSEPSALAASYSAAARLPDRKLSGLWWCAVPLCQKRSLTKGEPCPVHGQPMTMKGS